MKALWKLLRIMADVKAVKSGRYPQRMVSRAAHRSLSRGLRKLLG